MDFVRLVRASGRNEDPVRIRRRYVARKSPDIGNPDDGARVAFGDIAIRLARHVDLFAHILHRHERVLLLHFCFDDLCNINTNDRRLMGALLRFAITDGRRKILIYFVAQQVLQGFRIAFRKRIDDHFEGSGSAGNETGLLERPVGQFDLRQGGFERRTGICDRSSGSGARSGSDMTLSFALFFRHHWRRTGPDAVAHVQSACRGRYPIDRSGTPRASRKE